jgi:hypothetical protein
VHKEAKIQDKEARQRSKIQGATWLLLPSSPPSLPRLLVLITLGLEKKKEQGLIFNASTRDMVAGSGDGVTGRRCFLLGKFEDFALINSQ